jgi:hypothetical protein
MTWTEPELPPDEVHVPPEIELRRLVDGPPFGRAQRLLAGYAAVCPRGDAVEVDRRCRAVLRAVLATQLGDDPAGWMGADDPGWSNLLPGWFVSACTPAGTGLADQDDDAPWELASWLYFFTGGDDDRPWRWWSSTVTAPDRLHLDVEVDGWPVGWGALRWLVRAAGAHDLVERR